MTDQLRLDGGIRRESIDLNYTLDSGPGYPDGTNDGIQSPSDDEIAWTLAGNYDINDGLAVYARYSDGYLFPHFDDLREGNDNVNSVKQLEAGVKYTGDWMTAYATAYHNTNDTFSSTVGAVIPNESFQTRANGIEGDLTFNFGGQFTINVITTIQDAKITKSTSPDPNFVSNKGNKVLRQPDFQARISPAYDFDVGGLHGTVYGAYTMVGNRYADNANSTKLSSFNKFDLGVLLEHDSGFFFQLHGDNLNNSHGLTEGDPRNPTAPNGRPILGRSINFSVGYDFGD